MNVGEAISFVFEDEQWAGKLLVGALISLIPIFGGAALTGYAIAVLRNVEAGSQRPLPSWDRLGEYLVDGVRFWVVRLIYALPILILACPIALVWIPPAVAGENQDLTTVLSGIAGVVSVGLGCLGLLYGLLLWLLTPALKIRFAETGELGACLRFGEVFRFLSSQVGAIVISQLIIWAAGLVVTTVLGSIIGALALVPICGWVVASLLGLFFAPVTVWLNLLAAYLYGQVGREAAESPSLA